MRNGSFPDQAPNGTLSPELSFFASSGAGRGRPCHPGVQVARHPPDDGPARGRRPWPGDRGPPAPVAERRTPDCCIRCPSPDDERVTPQQLRFTAVDGQPGELIDLRQWRLNPLPDEDSDEDWDDDRELIGPDGRRVETWREGYPYDEQMQRREYEIAKRTLQIELLKLQGWVKGTSQKVVIVFEGRDAAGKGGTIKRFTEHLNPRGARVVALDKPSERERT